MIRKPYKLSSQASQRKRLRRRLRIRKKISGSAERPRICPVKSNRHLSVQVIDDQTEKTLMVAQTFGPRGVKVRPTKEGAKKLGEDLSVKMKDKGITRAVFDRAGYPYHGVIAALADSLREQGITI